jgi:hypothetical protein
LAAAPDADQAPVDGEREQDGGVVGGAARPCRIRPGEAPRPRIPFLDEGIDGSHRIVLGDVVIEALRQKDRLARIFALDESLQAARASQRVAVL